MKNPKWVKDELILALDLYFKLGVANIDHKNKQVIELSNILNTLPIHDKFLKDELFRNPTGVSMKLRNFQSLDSKNNAGLSNGSKLDKVVWDEFSNNKLLLDKIASQIKSGSLMLNKETVNDIIEEETEGFPEGKILYKVHCYHERNKKLVKKVKENAIKNNELFCSVCDFDFKKKYGELGEGFIECHHTIPVSDYDGQQDTNIKDLKLVCSNCHRMLHKKRPWLSIDDLKTIIINNEKSNII